MKLDRKHTIEVQNLSKMYRISNRERHDLLRDTVAQAIATPFKSKSKTTIDIDTNEFWALKNVSFSVKRGEVMGVIGKNGSGKSTLLKILSKITQPTAGEAMLRGRVASLLEVGTGFNPELTGRENIYLNGTLLGMGRSEIRRKFNDIVEFSGVRNFLDVPVKRYSSGMYVRLAFAVAAHLETDILLVDEVLAVGDLEFQLKSLGRMKDLAGSGRTVIFVSHDLNAVRTLCDSCIFLEDGRVKAKSNNVNEILNLYAQNNSRLVKYASQKLEWMKTSADYDNEWFSPASIRLKSQSKRSVISGAINRNEKVLVEIEGQINTPSKILTIGYALYNSAGNAIFWSYQTDQNTKLWPNVSKGKQIILGELPVHLLGEGFYRVDLIGGLHNEKWLFEPSGRVPSVAFEVVGRVSDSPYYVKRPTILAPIINWKQKSV